MTHPNDPYLSGSGQCIDFKFIAHSLVWASCCIEPVLYSFLGYGFKQCESSVWRHLCMSYQWWVIIKKKVLNASKRMTQRFSSLTSYWSESRTGRSDLRSEYSKETSTTSLKSTCQTLKKDTIIRQTLWLML